jgi:hypothetical protein
VIDASLLEVRSISPQARSPDKPLEPSNVLERAANAWSGPSATNLKTSGPTRGWSNGTHIGPSARGGSPRHLLPPPRSPTPTVR